VPSRTIEDLSCDRYESLDSQVRFLNVVDTDCLWFAMQLGRMWHRVPCHYA
jgi:hypothetical protein